MPMKKATDDQGRGTKRELLHINYDPLKPRVNLPIVTSRVNGRLVRQCAKDSWKDPRMMVNIYSDIVSWREI